MNGMAFLAHCGENILGFSLAFSLLTLLTAITAFIQKSDRLVTVAERSLYATCGLGTLAVILLVAAFLSDAFLLRYVYAYSNVSMPTIYKVTALWGGQEGSLLFWLWLSSLFATIATYRHRHIDRPLIPLAIAVFATILTFFGSLLVYFENPFKLFPSLPLDGRGLNPLLQNPSMAIHPPSLYLGYVGMSVPFAFALSALVANRLDTRWIVATRRWLLLSWFFLSIGNLLGAQWAYVELGWGGFWGWDPVENAALMPWLTASAFIHSVMIQERRGMLKFWNINLIVISFVLTILGTYLTRSGVVQSVHSFARSEIGYFFLGFLCVVILFSAFFIYRRRRELRSENIFESFLSKESAFVVNNIALVGAAFIVLWCTLFPTMSELVIGKRIVVGPPFFNQMLAPFAIVLLILTGIGPLIAWRKASPQNLRFHFVWPTLCGALTLGGAVLLGIDRLYVLLTIFGAVFVSVTVITELQRSTTARARNHSESWARALIHTIFSQNRKFGGYIVHLGIVFIFVGIAGAGYKEVHEFRMSEGQSLRKNEYSLRLRKFVSRQTTNHEEFMAEIELFVGRKPVAILHPARFFYFQQQQPSTEVDIYSRLKEDVYLTLGQFDPEKNQAVIHMTLNPLISFLWLGGLILIIGALVAMMPPLSLTSRTRYEGKTP